jgi:hypothetical protein
MSQKIQDFWDVTLCQCGVIRNILKECLHVYGHAVRAVVADRTHHIIFASSSAYTFDIVYGSACVKRN